MKPCGTKNKSSEFQLKYYVEFERDLFNKESIAGKTPLDGMEVFAKLENLRQIFKTH